MTLLLETLVQEFICSTLVECSSHTFPFAFMTSTEVLYKVVFKKLWKYILFVLFVVGRMGVLHTHGEVRRQLWHQFPPPIMWDWSQVFRCHSRSLYLLVQTMSFLTSTSLLQYKGLFKDLLPQVGGTYMPIIYNPSNWEAESGGLLWLQGQPGLHSRPCLKNVELEGWVSA